MKPSYKTYLLIVLAVLVLLLIPRKEHSGDRAVRPEDTLRCILPWAGANLEEVLVQKFTGDHGLEATLDVAADDANYLDSLLEGTADLVVTVQADSLPEGLMATRPFPDGTVWVLRKDESHALMLMNRWIGELSSESRFHQIQRDYQKGKPVHLTTISSYDPLVRKYAESIGWDWRLLSAIIFRESRFHPDANSHKGAIGLMQIRSSRYSTDTLLIPSVNLSVGTTYLKRLQNMFSSAAADTTECIKFTLAAYNAGEGRILQTIQTAREKGVDATRWDSVLKVIPDVPGFKGTQTIVYVEDVLNIYAFYTRFYPL
ncbi:MAG: transglycosylase SLT domain-containing protein [Bacteroidales bacterium]|nr:transglycosylase SLT domain-containing protein [Bacteroidales bacterium]